MDSVHPRFRVPLRAEIAVGLAGCVLLAFSLPVASVVTGVAVLPAGAPG